MTPETPPEDSENAFTMRKRLLEEIYKNGRNHGYQCYPRSENPFEESSDESLVWLAGWVIGECTSRADFREDLRKQDAAHMAAVRATEKTKIQ